MGAIHVHELTTLDGVIDAPTWTAELGLDPRMGDAIGAITQRCRGIPPRRRPQGRPLRQRQRHPGPRDARRRLVDELHLFVYPLTRGTGPRRFPDAISPQTPSLAGCQAYDNGVVYLAYRPQS